MYDSSGSSTQILSFGAILKKSSRLFEESSNLKVLKKSFLFFYNIPQQIIEQTHIQVSRATLNNAKTNLFSEKQNEAKFWEHFFNVKDIVILVHQFCLKYSLKIFTLFFFTLTISIYAHNFLNFFSENPKLIFIKKADMFLNLWKILKIKSSIFFENRQKPFLRSLCCNLCAFFRDSSNFLEKLLIFSQIFWQELAKAAKIFKWGPLVTNRS